MRKLLIPIITGTMVLYSCGSGKKIHEINSEKKENLENVVSSKRNSVLYKNPSVGALIYNDSLKQVYFSNKPFNVENKNQFYEKLDINLTDAENLFELQDFVVKDLVSHKILLINKKSIQDYYGQMYNSYSNKFGKNKSFSPEKAMYILLENSKKTIENSLEPNSEKINLFRDMIKEQYEKLESNKKNSQQMCRIKGKDTIAVMLKYSTVNKFGEEMNQFEMNNYASIEGQEINDQNFMKYSSPIVGKDNVYIIKNKVHYKVQKGKNKKLNKKEGKFIAYYYPVKLEELKGLKHFWYKITKKLEKTKTTFGKISNSLRECDEEDLDF